MIPFIVLAVGFLLIFCEFYLPGGILGTLGGLVVIASIVLFVMQYDSPIAIFLYIAGVIIALYYLFTFALWRIRHSKPGTSIYSEEDQEGYAASSFDKSAIGKVGVVETDLKPGGHIIVEGKKHHAISQSGYISKGVKVAVIGGQGESLTVKHHK
ncbi:MAG: NfeD family protein [Waddliaceae bacterium]